MIELPRRVAVIFKSPMSGRWVRGEAFAYRSASDKSVANIYAVQDLETGRISDIAESDLTFS